MSSVLYLKGCLSGKESACQCRRLRKRRGRGFNPWVRKILGKRKWQPTPVFLPGKILWTEEPGGLQSMGTQRVRHNLAIEYALILYLKRHQHTQGHVDFLLCYLLRVLLFYGLYLGLWSILSHFCVWLKVIHMKRCMCVYRFFLFFLAYECPVSPALFVEETIFATLYCLCSFVNDQLTAFMVGLFLGSLFCSIDLFICPFTNITLSSLSSFIV